MSYVIVKGNSSKKLDGIRTNDLPIRNKLYFNEITDKLEHKFSLDRIFIYHPDSYTSFETETEAQEYINYINRDIEQNRTRYEKVLQGSTNKLLQYASDLKVVEDIRRK